MEKHNVRAVHGKKKGKFVSQKRKVWRENVRAAKLKKVDSGVKASCTLDGTFLFEPKTLSQELKCNKCNKNIYLEDIKDIESTGLATIFKIMCNDCKCWVNVHTCRYKTSQSGHKDFDINLKLAVALIDAGIGEAQINCVLSALNIPTISSYLLNKSNRIVGPKIELFATETCIESIRKERERTLETAHNSISQSDDKHVCDVESSLSSSLPTEDDGNVLMMNQPAVDFDHTTYKTSITLNNNYQSEILDSLGCIKIADDDDDDTISQATDDDSVQTFENNYDETLNIEINNESTDEDDNSTLYNETDREMADDNDDDVDDNDGSRNNIEVKNVIHVDENNITVIAADCVETNNNTCCYTDKDDKVGIIASFDAAWQTRGTGRSYNSLTGHSSLIGHYTGKILSYAIRSKRCAMCEKGHEKNNHDCRKNFDRSAKAMEPDMAIQLVAKNKLLDDENVFISVLIGDDDASSIAAIRNKVNYDIKKWSDMNHAKKNLVKHLYSLSLSKKFVDYFSRAFTYAIQQNKGDVLKTETAIINIVDHAYGNHSNCGSWCRSVDEQSKAYVHRGLPYGKPLTDDKLKEKLTVLFTKYANSAEKLAPCGSSQRNESFNHIVSSKHPKNKFYGASESLHYRVAAAVAQKNFGSSYIIKVFEKLGLSPGKYMTVHRQRKDEQRSKKIAKSESVAFKQKRLKKKKHRSQKKATATKREGITYESGYGLTGPSQKIYDLIPPLPVIEFNKVEGKNIKMVFFDLETNSRSPKNAEICQISAISDNTQFNVYIMPTYMSEGARKVTNLSVENGKLYLTNEAGSEELETVSPVVAISKFKEYLQSIGNDIILIAHNGFRFDVPIILRYIQQHDNIGEFTSLIFGFADTLPLLKGHLKERVAEKKSFSLESLITDFFGPLATEGCHNALVDIKNLKRVTEFVNLPGNLIIERSRSIPTILYQEQLKCYENNRKKSLQYLAPEIKAGMISKIASAGLTWEILGTVFRDSGEEGIKILFMEDVGGRPRVTKKSSIITRVIEKLKNINQ